MNPVDDRKYYIGVRTSNVEPILDEKYQGSSKDLKVALKEIGHENFVKEILSEWDTRNAANKEEVRLHELFDVSKNREFYNKTKAKDNGFCTQGFVTVVDATDGKTKNVSKEQFDSNHNFVSIAKNTVRVLDTRDGIVKRVSMDDFEKNECYQSTMKNTIVVKDAKNGKNKRISLDEYATNKNLYTFTLENSITVIDIAHNTTKRVSLAEYHENNNYVNLKSNIVCVYDCDGKLKHTLIGDIYEESKKYNLPTRSLITSYNRNGEKMYRQISNPNNPRFKFKEWYAIKVPLLQKITN